MSNQGPEYTRTKVLLNAARGLETGRSLAYLYDYNSDRMDDNPEFIDADDAKLAATVPYSRNILLSSEERLASGDKSLPKTEKYKRNPIRVIDGKENNQDNINKVLIADVIIPEDDPQHDKPVYIAWTGSDNKEKWIADFVEGYPGEATYRRHEREMVAQIKEKLLEHYRKNPNKPLKLVFTGHSLGGALAQRNFNSFQKELLKDLSQGEKAWVSHMSCTVFNSAGVSKVVADSSNTCSKALVEQGIEQELTYVANRGDIVSQTGYAILNDPENNKAHVHAVFKDSKQQSSVTAKIVGPSAGALAGAVIGTPFGPAGWLIGGALGGAATGASVLYQQFTAHTANASDSVEIVSTWNPNEAKKVKESLDAKSALINRSMGNMTKAPDLPTLAQRDHFHADALKEQFEIIQRKLMGSYTSFTCVANSDGDNLFHMIGRNNRLDLWQACEDFKVVKITDLVNLDLKNRAGKTAIQIAIEQGHFELAGKMLDVYPGNKVILFADMLRWKKNLEKLKQLKVSLPENKQMAFDDLIQKAQTYNEEQNKAIKFLDIIKSKDPNNIAAFLFQKSGYFSSGWHVITSTPDRQGNTPLHHIAKMHDEQTAVALIEAIAKTTIRKTASLSNYAPDELVNLQAKSKNGKTPLDKAIGKGHFETAKAMVQLYPEKERKELLTMIEDKMKRKTLSTSYDKLKAEARADQTETTSTLRKSSTIPKK